MKYSNLDLALMARQLLIAKTERPVLYNQFIMVMHLITEISPPQIEAIIEEYTNNVGDQVSISAPKHKDSVHTCAFDGFIVDKVSQLGLYVVEDSRGDYFAVELDEIEGKYE